MYRFECSDIEFTDDEEDTKDTTNTNGTSNIDDNMDDVDIEIDELDGDTNIYLDDNDRDDNNDELDEVDDELDDEIDEENLDDDIIEDGDDDEGDLSNINQYDITLSSSIISVNLNESLNDSTNEDKKKKKGKSYSAFKNNFSILGEVLPLEEEGKLTNLKSLPEIRQNNIKILSRINLPNKNIRQLEQGIYNYTITKCEDSYFMPTWDCVEFKNTYINKSRTLFTNLVKNNYIENDYLLPKLKDKSIDCYQVAFLESHKLFPKIWQDIIDEKIKIEQILKHELQQTATDKFLCRRCKQRKTIYVQVQTRSADEPMTTFITCLHCGNKWKQY